MSVSLEISSEYILEGANYITCIKPTKHPNRILPFHDFLYMIDGEWEIIQDENVYFMHSDDLLILAAGRHHYSVKPCSANNRHMYIHAYCEEGSQRTEERQFNTLIHCQNNPRIKQLMEEMIAVHWGQEDLKELRLKMLFGLFLCEVYRQQSNDNGTHANMVEQAVNLVQTTPQTFFSSKDMASRLFICERTLNNLFRKTYGQTFYAYQMDRKLEMVRQYLLIHPEAKLDEAACNFGFCDAFHLGKAYKKKYGISPKRHISMGREDE